MSAYTEFLASKRIRAAAAGIDAPLALSSKLARFQVDCTRWALQRGRGALFQGCGLGKSWQAIEWARVVSAHTDKPVLILTPLAVASQFVREGEKLGVRVKHVREPADMFDGARIVVTNYERLDKFEQTIRSLGGVVLDESSILKAFDGKTRTKLIEAFAAVAFRLCCTATPSPNDVAELGNHAEFLGVMRRVDMLNRFFEHAGDDTSKWTLKHHGRKPFWRWVASWAICLNTPSDMGHSDEGYLLEPLTVHDHVIDVDQKMAHQAGLLFAYEAATLTEQRAVRRASLSDRVEAVARLVNDSPEQWTVWTDLNDESKQLAKAITGAVEITGSDPVEHKESAMLGFIDGKHRVLVSKSEICGFGVNLQCASHTAFVGAGHSFESWHQTVRRHHRFGQKRPVHVHMFRTSADGRIVSNLQRKQREHERMVKELAEVTNEGLLQMQSPKGTKRVSQNQAHEERSDASVQELPQQQRPGVVLRKPRRSKAALP